MFTRWTDGLCFLLFVPFVAALAPSFPSWNSTSLTESRFQSSRSTDIPSGAPRSADRSSITSPIASPTPSTTLSGVPVVATTGSSLISNGTNATSGGCQYWVNTAVFRWLPPISHSKEWAPSTTPTTTRSTRAAADPLDGFSFVLANPHVTLTAATQVIFVDPSTNQTSTSIIRNELTPTTFPKGFETNSEGTRITRLTFTDSYLKTQYTTVVTYPTPYVHYDLHYGQRPTPAKDRQEAISGATTSAFPSLPVYPVPTGIPTPTPNPDDPRGLFAIPKLRWGSDLSDFYQIAFPEVPVFQQCSAVVDAVIPGELGVVSGNDLLTLLTLVSTSFTVFPEAARTSGIESIPAGPVAQRPAPAPTAVIPATRAQPAFVGPKVPPQNVEQPPINGDSPNEISQPRKTGAPPGENARPKGPSNSPPIVDLGSVIGSLIVPEIPQDAKTGAKPAQPAGRPIEAGPTRAALPVDSPATPSAVGPRPAPGAPISAAPVVIGPGSFERVPITSIVIASKTLTQGGSVVVGSNPSATTFTINAAGVPLAIASSQTSTITVPPSAGIFTIGTVVATALSSSYALVFATQTLTPGASITVSGTLVSLQTDAAGSSILVVGTSTTTLSPLITPAPTPLNVQTTVISSGSTSITAYIIGSQTLYPGHPITLTVNSETSVVSISTDNGGRTVLVIGDKTTTLGASSTPKMITSEVLVTYVSTFLIGSAGTSRWPQRWSPSSSAEVAGATATTSTKSAGGRLNVQGWSWVVFGVIGLLALDGW